MTTRRELLAASAGLALSACGGSRRVVIGVVPKATAHIFWQTVQAGALAAGQEFHVDIEWNGPPAETEYSRQIQIIDSLVARHVNALAIAATDRTALIAPVERAVKAGIPVVIFDSGLDSDQYLTFLATNNYQGGQMAARKLGELIGGKGKVAMVMLAPGSYSTMERERGFRDVIAKEFPGVEIAAEQYSMSDRAKGLAAAENMLSAHPDLAGMFASAEPGSVGASLAIKQRDLAGKVKLVTFDSTEGLIEELKAGVIDAMVVQDPFRMGFEAVHTLVEHLKGKPPAKRIDLTPTLVTKGNLEQPEIHKLLHPDVQKYLK